MIRRGRTAWLAMAAAAAMMLLGAFGAEPALAGEGECPGTPVITGQPSTTMVGQPMSPPVVVKVENAEGRPVWSYDGKVVLTYAVNPPGAAEPSGNVVNAVHGVATFSRLTFPTAGFGFELQASVPGATSQPSQPFDVVGQLVTCAPGRSCRTGTVRSAGTSGSARVYAATGTGFIAATGGGFPALSCTTVGGVLTFSSNRYLDITIRLAGYLVQQAARHGVVSFDACWGAAAPFVTASGKLSAFNPANGDYEGLLPACGLYQAAPCVLARYGPWPLAVIIQVLAPPGDPHITF